MWKRKKSYRTWEDEVYITASEYFEYAQELFDKIDQPYDCIVALKRSGWPLGIFFSHHAEKPVFTESEVKSIPEHFTKILVVDDKVFKGKSLQKIKLKLKNKEVITATLFVKREATPDFYCAKFENITLFYEKDFLEKKNKAENGNMGKTFSV